VIRRVLFTAAHAGFARELVPLGGGAAVANQLIAEWTRTRPFELEVIDPSVLGPNAPKGRDLVKFGERDYAKFCKAFGDAVTDRVLTYDPADTAVLVNDVSEGPDLKRIAERGFRIVTIYHVDVVAYVADIYARGWVNPETLVRWYDRLSALAPSMARLVFEKQLQTVLFSRKIVVPSMRMREVIESCYGGRALGKVEVMPWGTWAEAPDETAVRGEVAKLREEFNVPEGTRVLLTLSRISPEKGQDLLLEVLRDWKPASEPVVLFICGDAAFMQGVRFLERLRRLASRMHTVRVVFPGYVTGIRKQAFQRLADLYVFPSRHESYGLTLLEALYAGLPAVCLDHHGAREVMRPEFGRIVRLDGLRPAIEEILSNPELRLKMSRAAARYARQQPFSATAARLAELIAHPGGASSNAEV
jgi:glycosyltransferase involved in cell wall biosynthesis